MATAAVFGQPLPTGRYGRLMAGGIAVVALGLLWLAVIVPLHDWYARRDAALDQRIDYAARMATIAADLPTAERTAALAHSQAPPTNIILAGNSDPVAGATLESLIDGLTRDAPATLISTEALPGVQNGPFRRIGLRVTVRAPWTDLIRLLAAIERADPRMSVGNLQIQAGPLGGAEQLLDMSFSVTAFRSGNPAPGGTETTTSSDAEAGP